MADVDIGMRVTWQGAQALEALGRIERVLDKLQEEMRELGDHAVRAGNQITNSMENSGRAVEQTTKKFNFMGSVMRSIGAIAGAVFVANIVRNFSVWVIRAAGDLQSLYTQMVITEGTFDSASAKVRELSSTFLQMGIDAQDGVGFYNRLALQGVSNSQALATSVMGLASTFGLSQDAIQRTGMAITQMFSKGTFVRAEEFNQQLQEALPQAAAVAAQGFREMGNTALDSVTEIQSAVRAGTLRVQDFTDAVIAGSDDFINTAAQITNIRVQFEGLIAAIRVSVGTMMQQSGVAQALAIVFNGLTRVILGTSEAIGPDGLKGRSEEAQQQLLLFAKQVADTVLDVLRFIGFLEAMGRTFGLLGAIVVDFGKLLLSTFAFLVSPITKFISVMGAVVAMDWDAAGREVVNFGSHTQNAMDGMAQSGRNLLRSFNELADPSQMMRDTLALTRAIGGRQGVMQAVIDAQRQSNVQLGGGGSDSPTADAASARAAEAAERMRERLERLRLQMEELGNKVSEAVLPPLNEFEQLMHDALSPLQAMDVDIRQLALRFQELANDGQNVTAELAALAAMQDEVAAATERATSRVMQQIDINNRRRSADVDDAGAGVARQQEDLRREFMPTLEDGFSSRLVDIERDLARRREEVMREVRDLTLEYDQQVLDGKVEDSIATQALIIQQQDLLATIEQINPQIALMTQRMSELMGSLKSTVTSSLTDLIVGLTDFENFDFGEWAENLVGNITRAIAQSWAEKLTDFIFEKLFGGRQQTVQRMTVQSMTVTGGVNQGGAPGQSSGLVGMIGNAIGGFFGGGTGGAPGGGGQVGILASIGQGLAAMAGGGFGFFEKGGVIGGPTLFGVAGEKNQEAIMPLERIGGKLGVNTSGTGDTFNANINISAIDTQSGADFLQRNAALIVGAVNEQWSMGRRT